MSEIKPEIKECFVMAAFEQSFGPPGLTEKLLNPPKKQRPSRGFGATRIPGMTDREFRLSIRKAHMMGAGKILCGADNKAKKGTLPFLVTRNWGKVTCRKCLELRK